MSSGRENSEITDSASKKSHFKYMVIVLCAIMFLAGMGFSFLFFKLNHSNSASEDKVSNTAEESDTTKESDTAGNQNNTIAETNDSDKQDADHYEESGYDTEHVLDCVGCNGQSYEYTHSTDNTLKSIVVHNEAAQDDHNAGTEVTVVFDGNRQINTYYDDHYVKEIYLDGNPITRLVYDDDNNVISGFDVDFDDRGNETKHFTYNEDGKLYYGVEYSYEYDSNDRISKSITKEYDENGTLLSRTETENDSDGNEIKSVKYSGDNVILEASELEYDDDGRYIKMICKNQDGSVTRWNDYIRDVSGDLVSVRKYNSEGILYFAKDYEDNIAVSTYLIADEVVNKRYYDKNSLLTIKVAEYTDGEETKWTEFEHDSAGRQINKTLYESGIQSVSISYEYDEQGDEKRRETVNYNEDGSVQQQHVYIYGKITQYTTYDSSGDISSVEEYEYDQLGRCINRVCYDGDGNIVQRYEYELDDNGNPIRCLLVKSDGTETLIDEWQYDENGNEVMHDMFPAKRRFEYIYM